MVKSMKKNTFSKGIEIDYLNFTGHITFVGDSYLTVCIQRFDHRVRDVNLLIYTNQWKDIRLKKESGK